jgi:hypothetical protein
MSRATDVLRRQTIGWSGPGTILHDFETLLEFIGEEGLRTTGKYYLIESRRLNELDEKMARPLRPARERPQLRSYPHLSGLYVLLRATRLAVPKGAGTTGMLVLDPAMVQQWWALNPTEQYFNLLEAWLRHGRGEMLGGSSGGADRLQSEALTVWHWAPDEGLDLQDDPRLVSCLVYSRLYACMLALFELFGLMEVDRGEPAPGENWRLLGLRRTKFGEAVVGAIFGKRPDRVVECILARQEDEPDFGAWQPIFEEYFPEWRNNLEFPEPEARDGVHYFKAKLGSPWRRIAIPADNSLEELARAIIDAFDFGGGHLYDFRFRERDGSEVRAYHPWCDDAEVHASDYLIGCLPLSEGQSMEFLYDYGTNWQFDVKLEKVGPPDRRLKGPRVVESRGEAPSEYGAGDEC